MATEIETSGQARAYLITADEPFARKTRAALAAFDSAWQDLSDLIPTMLFSGSAWPKSRRWNARAWSWSFEDTARLRSHALPWGRLAGGVDAAEAERLGMERILKSMEADNARPSMHIWCASMSLRARQMPLWRFASSGVAGGVLMMLLFAQGITSRIEQLHENIARWAPGRRLESAAGSG